MLREVLEHLEKAKRRQDTESQVGAVSVGLWGPLLVLQCLEQQVKRGDSARGHRNICVAPDGVSVGESDMGFLSLKDQGNTWTLLNRYVQRG